jgi:lipopolysaccharide export LptBFGC system permease protein LptF
MSKTLFWYIFWQLLRVFLLATLSLAGIMSFAGLLRPLTEHGLDIRQVNRMLLYMLPAMSTYSLPVAALFAATFVYGKFSADNELTAMRAGGISFLSMRRFSIALPALLLGLFVATVSLVMLCFIVPIFTYKVQEIIYSNIAKVITTDIERDHEVDFAGFSSDFHVFADRAEMLEQDPNKPLVQQVKLTGPALVTFENGDSPMGFVRVPREFWMARTAIVSITRSPGGGPLADTAAPTATFSVQLHGGIKFPREFTGNVQAGVNDTIFGPVPIHSPIRENVKFLNVRRLAQLASDPGSGERVQDVITDLIRREQQLVSLNLIADQINRGDSPSYRFETDAQGDTFIIGGQGAVAQTSGDELVITAPTRGDDVRTVWMRQLHLSQETFAAKAKEIHLRVAPDPMAAGATESISGTTPRMEVSIELYDTLLQTPEGASERMSFIRTFSDPMPPEVRAIASKTLEDFRHDPLVTPDDAIKLHHEQVEVNNAARSELHGRASFAISCLVLVMVGAALGVMFKSGNVLNAFAVSFLPALLSITLIFCGQQAATHVPVDMGKNFYDPLHTGLLFIWSGNLIVLAAAVYLTYRLQKR